MKMFAVSEHGDVFRMILEQSSEKAGELLSGVAYPKPMYIGKIGPNASMFVLDHGCKTILFNMPELKISTRYALSIGDDEPYIYPTWVDGLPARMTWKPPHGWLVFMVTHITSFGSASHRLFTVQRGRLDKQWPMPIKNVFPCSTICMGDEWSLPSITGNFTNVSKFMEIPKLFHSTEYNYDAGPCRNVSNYAEIFRWNANTNEQIHSPQWASIVNKMDEVPEENKISTDMLSYAIGDIDENGV